MKLLLHIGYPKTGTTTLQKNVFSITDKIHYITNSELKKDNFKFKLHYDDDPIHIISESSRYKDYFNKIFRSDKLNLISDETILSTSLRPKNRPPFIYYREPASVALMLEKIFSEHDTEILITIRNQKDLLKSYYAEKHHEISRFRGFKNFNRFIEYVLKNPNRYAIPALRYYEIAHLYQDLFGKDKVHILIYEDMKHNLDGFIQSLSDIMGQDFKGYKDNFMDKKNVRSSDRGYRTRRRTLFSLLYGLRKMILGDRHIPLPQGIKKVFSKEIPFTSRTLKLEYTEEQERQLFDHFKESNKRLDEEFNLNLKEYGYY